MKILVSLILLLSLVACSQLSSKRQVASESQKELTLSEKDLLLLEATVKKLNFVMNDFELKIKPIIKRTTKLKYPELGLAEDEDINAFWTSYMDLKIILTILQESYKNPKEVSQDDLTNASLIRYVAQLCLLSSGAEIVRSVWDNKFMRKKLDMSNIREIPEGSFFSLEKEVFRRVSKNLKKLDEEEELLFPSDNYDEAMADLNRHFDKASRESPLVLNLIVDISKYEGLLTKNKAFLKSRHNRLEEKKRVLSYEFKKKVYDPIFVKIATWMGDTKIKRRNPELHYGNTGITKEKALDFTERLLPGDFILARGNWYLSNAFLPGFWPHSIIYTGDVKKFTEYFNSDNETENYYERRCEAEALDCSDFPEYLASSPLTKKAWENFNSKDAHGENRIILEAISEGTVFSSVYNIMADYLASLRPRLSVLEKARALEEGFKKFDTPYDFDFDWSTDDKIVCSELLSKSFKAEPRVEKTGLKFDYDLQKKQYYIITAGHYALPPTQLVFKAYDENVGGLRDSELEFLSFLKNNPKTNIPEYVDEKTFYESRLFPKWSFMQK